MSSFSSSNGSDMAWIDSIVVEYAAIRFIERPRANTAMGNNVAIISMKT